MFLVVNPHEVVHVHLQLYASRLLAFTRVHWRMHAYTHENVHVHVSPVPLVHSGNGLATGVRIQYGTLAIYARV